MSKDRVTFSLTQRQVELLTYAVGSRRSELLERARKGDHKARLLATEYEDLHDETERIANAVAAHRVAA